MNHSDNKNIVRFLILTFVFSWAIMGYIIYLGGLRKAGVLVLLTMWVPAIVSLLYRKIAKFGFSDVGWRLGHIKYWAMAFLVPLAVAAIAYGISWLVGVNSIEIPSDEVLTRNGVTSPLWLVVKIYPLSFLIGCAAALGEEIGWRGFLIPKLCYTKIKHPLIVSSLIWGVWHYPLILWGGYATSDMPIVSAILFTVMILFSGVFVGWLRLQSGSVWVAMIYHAAHNLFLQTAFEVFNKPGPNSQYLAGESGVIPCAVYILILTTGYKLMNTSSIGKQPHPASV